MASKLDHSIMLAVPCPVAAVQSCIEQILTDNTLQKMGEDLKHEYIDIFPPDIPDTAELPDDVLMKIKLRDKMTLMVAHCYGYSIYVPHINYPFHYYKNL
jgi:hypothetical protein